MSKKLSRADADTLRDLVARYGRAAVIKEIDAAPRNRRGAPAAHDGNAVAVFEYLEFHRKQQTDAGVSLGLAGARRRLARVLNKYTTNCKVTDDALRGLYEKGKKLDGKFVGPSMHCRIEPDIVFPLLLIKMEGGGKEWLESPIIDRAGRGGNDGLPEN